MRAIDYKIAFENIPGCHILVAGNAPHFTIEAVSDHYAEATFTLKNKIIGQDFFSVFCDNPDQGKATGMKNLYRSFQQVVDRVKPHKMEVQKYDVRFYEQDMFVEKYWDPVNTPMLDNRHKLHIIHTVTDITVAVKMQQATLQMTTRSDSQKLHPDLETKTPGAILFYGPNLHVRYINKKMMFLLGRSPEHVVGRPGLTVLNQFLFKNDVAEALLKTYTSKEPCFLQNSAIWAYPLDEEESSSHNNVPTWKYYSYPKVMRRHLNISFEPVMEKDGSIYGVVAFFSSKDE